MSALLLTVYICNIIYESRDLDIASYTDKNTLNTFSQEVVDVLQTLENKTKKLFNSFQNYYFKLNIDSVIYWQDKTLKVELQFSYEIITIESRFQLLDIHIETRLSIDYHVEHLSKKAKKMHPLLKLKNYRWN